MVGCWGGVDYVVEIAAKRVDIYIISRTRVKGRLMKSAPHANKKHCQMCCYGVVTVKSTIGIQNAAPLLFKMRPPADVSKD